MRQHDKENCPLISGIFQAQLAAMVFDNFLGDIQSQAGAVFFSVTEEWLKDVIAHTRRYSLPVVADPNLKSIIQVAQGYRNRSGLSRNGSAGI
jgi:hypothetical protein